MALFLRSVISKIILHPITVQRVIGYPQKTQTLYKKHSDYSSLFFVNEIKILIHPAHPLRVIFQLSVLYTANSSSATFPLTLTTLVGDNFVGINFHESKFSRG